MSRRRVVMGAGSLPPSEWPTFLALVAGSAISSAVRSAVEEWTEDETAHLRLIAICGPEDSTYTQAVLAEVERRWEVHQEHARTLGRVQLMPKRMVIESVARDAREGLL